MNQRKNAFTLIELLAVIIILAAIALIVAPLVLDIIKEQQMKTFKESINGILRSSRLEIVNSGLKFPATFTYSDGKLLSPTGKELKVTGKIPEGTGSVRYNSEDNIDLAITDNTWCGTYNKTSKEVEVSAFNGTCEVPLVYTPEKCFEFDIGSASIWDYYVEDADCPSDVVIPETINGVIVKEIGGESFIAKGITSVILPSKIEEIQGDAFASNELTSIDFSNLTELTTIGSYAFDSNQLTNVDLSSLTNLEEIGEGAFEENQIKDVNVSNLNNLTYVGNCVFYENPMNGTLTGDFSKFTCEL